MFSSILGTQAIHNIYVSIIMYVMNSLGSEDGFLGASKLQDFCVPQKVT